MTSSYCYPPHLFSACPILILPWAGLRNSCLARCPMFAPSRHQMCARCGSPSLLGGYHCLHLQPPLVYMWSWVEIFQTLWVQSSLSLTHCLFLGHYVRQAEFVSVQSRSPDSLRPLRIHHPELLFVGHQNPLLHSQAQMLLSLSQSLLPPWRTDPSPAPWLPASWSHKCLKKPLPHHSDKGHVLPA